MIPSMSPKVHWLPKHRPCNGVLQGDHPFAYARRRIEPMGWVEKEVEMKLVASSSSGLNSLFFPLRVRPTGVRPRVHIASPSPTHRVKKAPRKPKLITASSKFSSSDKPHEAPPGDKPPWVDPVEPGPKSRKRLFTNRETGSWF